MSISPKVRQEAARELLRRRKARVSLLESIKYAAPWFKVNWHHQIVCELLERVERTLDTDSADFTIEGTTVTLKLPRHITRLMVAAPPRHGKSEIVSVRRPAYSIGRDVTRMFMNIAYGSDLALTFSKSCVGVMLSEAYKRLFPHIKFDRKANERWKVSRPEAVDNQRDSMIASGIMSPLTGEGATDANVDDPFKNKSEAYSQTIRNKVADEYQTSIRTRLQKGATVCLMMTRWHQDDLSGRLIKQARANKKADQWIVLVLAATNDDGERSYLWNTRTDEKQYLPAYQALWPEMFPREDLDATQASMAGAFWEAMYQQAPTTAKGSIFKADKWGEYDEPLYLERAIHVWDTAMEDTETADYSAHICMGIANGRYTIRTAYRERLEFPDLVRMVYKRWDEDVTAGVPLERLVIEQKGSGISLLQTIEGNNIDPDWAGSRIPVIGMPATLSKEVRALSVSGYQEAGLCCLPRPQMDSFGNLVEPTYKTKDGDDLPWIADFIEEHTAFPRGANDDWVDTFVHGLTYYTRPLAHEEHEEIMSEHEHYTISDELDSIDAGIY